MLPSLTPKSLQGVSMLLMPLMGMVPLVLLSPWVLPWLVVVSASNGSHSSHCPSFSNCPNCLNFSDCGAVSCKVFGGSVGGVGGSVVVDAFVSGISGSGGVSGRGGIASRSARPRGSVRAVRIRDCRCRNDGTQSKMDVMGVVPVMPVAPTAWSRAAVSFRTQWTLSSLSSSSNDNIGIIESEEGNEANEPPQPTKPQSKQSKESKEYPLVIVLGGSGFLGTELRRQLDERGVAYIATSTPNSRKDDSPNSSNFTKSPNFVPLDLTDSNAEEQFYQLLNTQLNQQHTSVAVISAMGSIGTPDDAKINSALVHAIRGAYRFNCDNFDNCDNSENSVHSESGANAENDGVKHVGRVERFVMIGNPQRVRKLTKRIPFLKGYADGKDEAESALRHYFGSRGCIIKPSFIYGGDEINLSPPRIPTPLGNLASELLSLYPVQALADSLDQLDKNDKVDKLNQQETPSPPSPLSALSALAVPLAPPTSVEIVASAAIHVALGIVEGYTEELEGREAIGMAGSDRIWKEKEQRRKWEEGMRDSGEEVERGNRGTCSVDVMENMSEELRWKRIEALKDKLLGRDQSELEDDIAIMEELECLRPPSMKPAYDPKLNGRWNFVLSKDDLGTRLIKELLPLDDDSSASDASNGMPSPLWNPLKSVLQSIYKLNGLYMEIFDQQSQVQIVLSSKVCMGMVPVDVKCGTSLISTNYEAGQESEDGGDGVDGEDGVGSMEEGCLFLERFESVEIGGVPLPIPDSWQRLRYLEITFLDDEIMIARGSGGEPHVLVRDGT